MTVHTGKLGGNAYDSWPGLDRGRTIVKRIVLEPGVVANEDSSFLFANFENATAIDGLENLDTSMVTDMSLMFAESSITELDLSSFDTSMVTDMLSMFGGSAITALDLSSFDTSQVTNMSQMFYDSAVTTLNLSSFNTDRLTDMSLMFGESVITELDLSSFNTSKVTTMASMFYRTPNLWKLSLGKNFKSTDDTDLADSPGNNTKINDLNESTGNFTTTSSNWRAVGDGTDHDTHGSKYSAADLMKLYSTQRGDKETYVWDQTQSFKVQSVDLADPTVPLIEKTLSGNNDVLVPYQQADYVPEGYHIATEKEVQDAGKTQLPADNILVKAGVSEYTMYVVKDVKYDVTLKYVDETGQPIAADEVETLTEGDPYSYAPKPIDKYTFQKSDQPLTGTINSDMTITLTYKKDVVPAKQVSLTVKYVDETGKVIGKDDIKTFTEGDVYDYKAKDIDQYTFQKSDKPLAGTINSDMTITLTYKKDVVPAKQVALTVKYVDENGKAIDKDDVEILEEGASYAYKAKAISQYTYQSSDKPLTGTINADMTITLTYKKDAVPANKVSLTVKYVDENGKAIDKDDVEILEEGASYAYKAKAINQYTYQSSDKALTGTINSDMVITLTYKKDVIPAKKVSLTVKYVDENGKAIDKDDIKTFTEGDAYDYKAKAIDQYTYQSSDKALTGTINSDMTITLTYKKDVIPAKKVSLIVKYVDENGKAIAENVELTGEIGETYTIEQLTIKGYTFAGDDSQLTGEFSEDGVLVLNYKKIKETVETPEPTEPEVTKPVVPSKPAPSKPETLTEQPSKQNPTEDITKVSPSISGNETKVSNKNLPVSTGSAVDTKEATLPQTGDASANWMTIAAGSILVMLSGVFIFRKRN